MNTQTQLIFRNAPAFSDKKAINEILNSSGYFYDQEISVAEELLDENLLKGEAKSGYSFIFADHEDKTVGFTCFGKVACTESSYDLYWIAVHKDYMCKGIGKTLLQETEKSINKIGGKGIYIETSGRELYQPTQGFYLKSGYTLEAKLEHFYAVNDSKLIYVKRL